MDIGQFYDIVRFISNKNQGAAFSPDEFNNSVNLAQRQLMDELVEAIQGWDGNRKRIRLPMGNAQQAIQKVAPFIVRQNGVAIPGNGEVPKPLSMAHMLAVRIANDTNRNKRVEHDRIFSNLNSKIDLVSENPFHTEYDTFYQIFPASAGTLNWEYIKYPDDAKYAYTTVNGRPVYDQANSIQLKWDEGEITGLISRVLFMFGISIQAQNLVSYYQSIKNDGQ